MRGVLPSFVLSRGKQGYSLPIKNWLRQDLRDYLTSVLRASPLMREHFNPHAVDALIDQHMRRTHNHNHVLWALLNLSLWHRRFIEQRPLPGA
jgi:asparagine synthase (glutamine-hydrolysing)